MTTVHQLLEHKGRAIFRIRPDEPVLEAIRSMAEHHIGALLVMREQELVGIVSERDYARKVVLMGRSASDTAVSEIMTARVTTVGPQTPIEECMRLMTQRRIRHLPVIEDGQVAGVVSIGDLVKAVIEDQQQEIEQLESYIRS